MIELANVSRYFGELCAVDNLSFSLSKGEILGLLGPNGAGKTTTMRMITGYLTPSAGSIQIDGMDVAAEPAQVKNRIGYLPEMAPFYGDMMVYDYLLYAARMHGLEDRERIAGVAGMCSIRDVMHKNIETLSRGYKQRVGLAVSLIHDPDILILDEPTSGLDPNQITEVRRLIREIGRTKTVIISTHILPEVEGLCDRVMIINRGHLAADSPTAELVARFGRRVTIRVQVGGCGADELISALGGIEGVDEVLPDGNGEPELASVLVSSAGKADLRPELFHAVADRGWELYELSQTKNSLEEVFRGLTVEGAQGGPA
jgi:gliding motility-associated transport system ATP-binding protein